MYLILTDPTARTVRVEESLLPKEMMVKIGDCYYEVWLSTMIPVYPLSEAEAHAKDLAIKENLIYTPNPEY